MTKAKLSPPERIGGNLALDLANTISWRGTSRETDHLADADAILAWVRAVGLVPANFAIPAVRRRAFEADVHRLRDAVMRAGEAIAEGKPPPKGPLAAIRDLAAGSLAAATLRGAPIEISFAPEDRIVGALAWAALDLLRSNELDRLKRCPADNCHWLFLDRTKNRSRRWCDMATCGNQAKARKHRAFQCDGG
ncbi:MAG: CGNR zinc finger domain-containing protein [Bradyrhizobium sp.]|nr:CGNR zinc finger domain-containing protein [Bradyrhizobium sp.]